MTLLELSGETSFTELLKIFNIETSGLFGASFILLFVAVAFSYFYKKYSFELSLFLSEIGVLFIIPVLFLLELIDESTVFLYIILLSLTSIIIYVRRERWF